MCGIVGVFDPLQESEIGLLRETVTQMTAPIAHRGPDDIGVWVEQEGRVALGHRRLSIIDLTDAGKQPMQSSNGRWIVAYNGEMYNTEQIRKLLGDINFKGHSDTEVLVEALAQWGVEKTVRQINAMFAFAAWDSVENELWLGRDRFGEKPLYYGWHGELFLFGSELKALAAVPGFSPDIDRQALGMLVSHLTIPDPNTIYRGVMKLPPGSVLCVRSNDKDLHPIEYWNPVNVIHDTAVNKPRGNEAVDELEDLLTEVVKSRMESDVPLGAFLSGGIDSSTIVALMQKTSTKQVETFTIGFHENGYDESPHAKAVATHLQTNHTQMVLSSSDATSIIAKLPDIYDEPFADSSQIPTYLLSALAKKQVDVALSGDGGDELFGGYERYRVFEKLGRLKGRVPQSILSTTGIALESLSVERWNKLGESAIGRFVPQSARSRMGEKVQKLSKLLRANSDGDLYQQLLSANLESKSLVIGYIENVSMVPVLSGRSRFENAMITDTCSYLPNDILTKVDRASMAVSLEVRVPLLDPEIFSFAWSLHPDDRVRNGVGKWPLRQVLNRYVPAELVERPKMGFGVPIGKWLRGDLRDWAAELLDPQLIREQGFFHVEPVQRMWEEHLLEEVDRAGALWPILMFQAWFQKWHSA